MFRDCLKCAEQCFEHERGLPVWVVCPDDVEVAVCVADLLALCACDGDDMANADLMERVHDMAEKGLTVYGAEGFILSHSGACAGCADGGIGVHGGFEGQKKRCF